MFFRNLTISKVLQRERERESVKVSVFIGVLIALAPSLA
jgi:hypothetical protein